jgi:hypothetical protein
MELLPVYKDWFRDVAPKYTDIDSKAIELTGQAYDKIDCLACGQCCRTTVTTFTLEDINKASKAIGISKKHFIQKYLFLDLDGQYTTISVPCPFLNLDDNKCKIYEARPHACSSFPHTDRKNFLARKKVHLENVKFCGITEYVLDGFVGKDVL